MLCCAACCTERQQPEVDNDESLLDDSGEDPEDADDPDSTGTGTGDFEYERQRELIEHSNYVSFHKLLRQNTVSPQRTPKTKPGGIGFVGEIKMTLSELGSLLKSHPRVEKSCSTRPPRVEWTMEELELDKWICGQCTLENVYTNDRCEECGSSIVNSL